ncbi:SdiA-regulated domain-containing protein, partial [Salmonella enterica]
SGLRDDIPLTEWISMYNENNLFIVSDTNLFYKFSCDLQND